MQVDNYVPDARKLKSNEWVGVLQQEAKLVEMFTGYITQPIAENAEETVLSDSEPPSPLHRSGTAGSRGWSLGNWMEPEPKGTSRWAVVAAGVVVTTAVATALYYRGLGRGRPRLIGLAGTL